MHGLDITECIPVYLVLSSIACITADANKGRWSGCNVNHRVKASDNILSAGDPFPNSAIQASENPDQYAVEKELYLGSLCQVDSGSNPWQFWMIMLKNGNFDVNSTLCPNNGKPENPIRTNRTFPCFGKGCMNQPIVHHTWSEIKSGNGLTGSFYGTYDLDANLTEGIDNISYYSVVWEKNPATGSWVFSHKLKTSKKYPWLMLYLRADTTRGYSGGYHYETRGMMKQLPESPNFKVRLTLDVQKGGGPSSQFYLVDIGSCWKNDGRPCDGDVETDVTRYTEMIINPSTTNVCSPQVLSLCPPYHITASGTKIYRNDTEHFPYTAYHLHCSPGNAKYLEEPFNLCDPYSNPQAQEIMQLLPHPEWAVHGYPSKKGEGWIGDSRTWELDVGGLSDRLYFYQDPGTKPARRLWTSVDVGTEIYISNTDEIAEWTLSDFDVLVPVEDTA
ncbi:uncharacterized protein LOC131073524 isoform X2 [Cryptomeria japonica]|uniref:uncharacterized protein LOC131073524 isoform X2 n=1 Tax=Cryptomeria japonica TaxID=3369 RepID=UPI0027DA2253|nr:uncharacterized protein LOC131073524 isoform X2 [Cryptomeria japonica]